MRFGEVSREELIPLNIPVDIQKVRDAQTWEKFAGLPDRPRTEPWAKVTTQLIPDIQAGESTDDGFVPAMTDVVYHQHEPKDVLGLAGTVEIGGRVSYSLTTNELRQVMNTVTLVGGVITAWVESDELITTAEACL